MLKFTGKGGKMFEWLENEYLENDFAQIEHLNQIVANNINHESMECFDTAELIRQFPSLGVYDAEHPDRSYIQIKYSLPKNNAGNPKNTRHEDVNGFSRIRYNSFIVTIRKIFDDDDEEYYQYIFEVRNSLWDGYYTLSKSYKNANGGYDTFDENSYTISKTLDDEDVTTTEQGNVLIITIKGNDRNRVRVCFRMKMLGKGREIKETNLQLQVDGELEYTHQYDTTNYEKAKVSLNNGMKASNVTITLKPCDKYGVELKHDNKIGAYIPEQKLTKISGEFDMPYGPTSVPGDYYCIMEASSNKDNIKNSATKKVLVHKVQNEHIELDWDTDQYKDVYKGCIYIYKIPFNLKNEYNVDSENKSKIIGTPVNVTLTHVDGKRTPYSSTIQYDKTNDIYYAEVEVSYRGYYEDYSYLEVEISPEHGFGTLKDNKRLIQHPWFIAQSFNDIIGQLWLTDKDGNYVDTNGKACTEAYMNDLGTDWIFLDNKTYNVTKTILIPRPLTIASLTGKSNAILDGGENESTGKKGINIIKTVPETYRTVNKLKVNLVGLTFQNAQCAVYSQAGTRLLVERCYFTHNKNDDQHHKGCSIFIPDTDFSVKNHMFWNTEIRNSYFYNNKGNEIQSIGTTRIMGCLFVTDSATYLQQPEVKVVSVRAGTVSYINNKSYINTGRNAMPSNHSFAKALAYVEYGASFNGRGPNQLGGDMTLPLYGHPYNNEAYTYAIYYYPYDDVRTEIVCSPRKGYERRATGHGSSFKRWIYYDGYHFFRWNKGRVVGNTYDPWSKEELAMPTNLGIFDVVKEKFITDYDPRVAGAKSMISVYDVGVKQKT